MDDLITAVALRQAFRETDGLEPLVLPDGEVVNSVEADTGLLRDALENAAWIRTVESGASGVEQTLAVWPSDAVQVNFFLGWGTPLEFDFDLREMVDDEAVCSLVRLLRLVSSAVSKNVIIRPEGQSKARPVLHVDAGTGTLTLIPRSLAKIVRSSVDLRHT